MITVSHRKGNHRPDIISALKIAYLTIFRQSLRVKVCFTPSCRYILPDEDQQDWNKILGSTSFPWDRKKTKENNGKQNREELLLAWRYLPEINRIELAYYSRDDHEKSWSGSQLIKVGQPAQINIGLPYPWPGISWFGGNRKAPQNIHYYIKVL